ncbi:MAG: isocitrate lyase/phosphoenolpyruvate mutase family protein [Alphaproteobacteria bacterium]|nr:isocitrate lyase/phosphoenolpyruvate mutase family protein [Alphaproteobacteria bacterium]MCB9928629.1 isocitrate lyase/phosphoenolpyruvate mutase family protein [Alphaproteobacteria bacterium]
MRSQVDKADLFARLHRQEGIFVIPNPWDVTSAKMLAGLGYKALATTSAGMAWSLGLGDSQVGREQVLEHCRMLAAATDLPLAADLEDCFSETPEGVAETIRLGAEAGLVGGSVEDWAPGRTGDAARIRPIAEAAERVAAAAEAARALPFPFMLCARAENHIRGVTDLADTIRRLQAFQEAGADVLYAPGLRTLEDIRSVLSEIDRPFNMLMGGATGFHTIAELAALGVKRVSLGGAFANAAYSALLNAAKEVAEQGTFTFRNQTVPAGDIVGLLQRGQ